MMQLIFNNKEGKVSVTHRFYPTVKNLTAIAWSNRFLDAL